MIMQEKSRVLRLSVFGIIVLISIQTAAVSQPLMFTRAQLIQYTPEWDGERFPDGRPKVPDHILERMKSVKIEEAWGVLRGKQYDRQFERGFMMTHEDGILVGRAITAQYMPKRPVLDTAITEIGRNNGREGGQIHWPINELTPGDVYVADVYRSVIGGPVVGGNLATAIYDRSGNGVLLNGEVRDLEQIEEIEGFQSFVRGTNPTWSWCSMLIGLNVPVNIGEVTVMPGDIILGKRAGVIVIPPHLAEQVCKSSELIRLKDEFGFLRLKEKKYTPGQIDGKWADEIERDYSKWLERNMDRLSVPKEQIQEILRERTW
jgi:4-hydroxy-4-methyl-2-oxoglutarate aldolase